VSSNPTSTSTGRAGRRIQLRSSRGRAALAGAALLVALPVLAACSAGSDAAVYQIQPDNGEGKVGYMYISNVWVVLDSTTGDAEVIGQVANTAPAGTNTNTLTSVSVGGATATIVPPSDTTQLAPGVQVTSSSVVLPGLKSVQFGETGQPELEVQNSDVQLGSNTQVDYTFANGQSVSVTAIVEPDSGLWASYTPGQVNGASPSAGATGVVGVAGAGGAPSSSATSTVSANASGTATASGTAKATGTAKASGTASASSSATVTP
jgi:hypothetical protein